MKTQFLAANSDANNVIVRFGLLAAWLLLCLGQHAVASDSFHAGPLYDDYELTLSTGHRTEAVGPFYFREEEETRRTWGIPPLFSVTRDPATESSEFNLFYPVITSIRYGEQYRWHIFQLFSFAGGPTQVETNRHRFTLFPFYFQQRSSDPSQNYTAIIPFYGHLKDRLLRDEIFFVMLPGYIQSRKKDVVTDNYLYPFFHLRHGDGLYGWQFWPLVGHEHKDLTTRTNGFGDVTPVPGHDDWFVLWPFYFNHHSGIGSDNPVWNQGVIPFYAKERSPKRDSTTVFWPFFSHITDRENNYREWDLPWPLIEFARGPGKHTTRVWPFFSHASNTNLEKDFYLWPVYKYDAIHADPLDRHRTRILFWLYSDLTERNTETGQSRRRINLLPLFEHTRDFNGSTRLQILALFESFLPGNPNIAREYAPVYSLWRSEKNAQTGATSQSLLWNLYRHQTSPGSARCSALFGLFQYQSDTTEKRLKLFYIPVVHTRK
jgi:hypothetical protein